MNLYYITYGSLALNFILLICLFSRNIIALFHKYYFQSRNSVFVKTLEKVKETITIEKIVVINEYPLESDYLRRKDFDHVEVGDLIHRFTTCRPYSKGVYSYNGTRKVTHNDKEKKILTLNDIDNPMSHSYIHYSGKEYHGMTEEGMTLRGSESFECYYNEKYTKTRKY